MTEPTRLLPFGAAALGLAAELIARGKPVAVPTETVYGLAGDATSGAAVAAIYAAKGRPSFNPLIVHVADLAGACALAELDGVALALAGAWWPGPLTIVAPLRAGAPIAALVTAGLPTLAVRVPAHPAMQGLIAAVGRPLAAPSANLSGSISPTRADHVLRSLQGRIPLVIDGGPCTVGLESTIVASGPAGLHLLRPGPIVAPELERVSGVPVVARTGSQINAPGQIDQHYAPSKPVRINAVHGGTDEWLIGFGAVTGQDTLSGSGDLTEAAARLFEALHRADASDRACIAIAPVPNEGLGLAINDRLKRAAA